MKIAILLTSYNRKEKTLRCLERINSLAKNTALRIDLEIYLLDDASTDGTAEAVTKARWNYPVHLLKGSGSLYWAGGMREAWKTALLKGSYDGYLWLNDDTLVLPGFFEELLFTEQYCIRRYGMPGIYIGSTHSEKTGRFTYGGRRYKNKFFGTLADVVPSDSIQTCELANGNITYISDEVVRKIGIIPQQYIHGVADYHYTYLAYTKHLPLLVMRGYRGMCEDDHENEGYGKFFTLSFRERKAYLYAPRGLQFRENLLFQRRFFWWRYPLVFLTGWFKILFPFAYSKVFLWRQSPEHEV